MPSLYLLGENFAHSVPIHVRHSQPVNCNVKPDVGYAISNSFSHVPGMCPHKCHLYHHVGRRLSIYKHTSYMHSVITCHRSGSMGPRILIQHSWYGILTLSADERCIIIHRENENIAWANRDFFGQAARISFVNLLKSKGVRNAYGVYAREWMACITLCKNLFLMIL
jgi:hypothetical protein